MNYLRKRGEKTCLNFMKNIYEFVNRIIPGDCVEVIRQMPAGSVDFIATDPPYLVGYTSRDGRSIANDKTDEWLMPACREMYRVLKYNRFLVCFYGWNKVDYFFAAWKAAGFRPVGHLVWIKHYYSKESFVRYSHESAYLLAKGDPSLPAVDRPSCSPAAQPCRSSPAKSTPPATRA